ncbi:MAG: hypothetical protein NVSMB58_28730 [Terriglobales bacterium]
MVLLAAFQTLLGRYSNQDDIVVGTPIANRNRTQIENLIGFFANTLALRVDLSGDPPFRELLQRVKKVALDGYAHQDLPFERVVEELQPERSLGHSPIFQVLFSLQNTPQYSAPDSLLTLQPFDVPTETAKFDLCVFLVDDIKELRGWVEYSMELFDEDTIVRLLDHFEVLLRGVVEDPNRRISDLPLLSEAELRQVVREWNLTDQSVPKNVCAHHVFEAQVEKTPDAVAATFNDQKLTYSQLNCKANQLAHFLRNRGVVPDSVVGIAIERSLETVIGVLGILKAGAAYAALDPAYPQDRLSYMLENARARWLLTRKSLLARLPEGLATPICLDVDWSEIEREATDNPTSEVMPENLAYVIYTSGSTGQPKGVAMPHGPLVNLMYWQREQSHLHEGVKTLQFASLSFDVSFQEMFSTWGTGGTLVLVSEELRQDAVELLRFIETEQINRLFLPFVALQQLAEVADSEKSVPASLREVITAGEQLQVTRQILHFFRCLKNCTLQNQYGPSETHVVTSYALCGSPENWPSLPPIGRPISNTRIYILDAHLRPVPVGVAGELYLGGDCLARGYLHREDLTAERFLPDPFSSQSGARVYKTGDRARFLADGNVEFLGRLDDQVKIRGFRIELGEVQSAIAEYSGVQQCAVVAWDDNSNQKRLVAYVVGAPEVPIVSHDLRAFLKLKLPEYMVPSAFVMLEALPLTPSGKISRRALPRPDITSEIEKSYVAPRSPDEDSMAAIWSEVLCVPRVGINDNFFELGGHSLLATKVVSRIRRVFDLELPLRALFEAPSVGELSERLRSMQSEVSTPPALVTRCNRSEPIPLSFSQQRLWLIQQLNPGTTMYNVPLILQLKGTLEVPALQQAVSEIVRRHEVLRTIFVLKDDLPIQEIAPPSAVPLPIVEVNGRPAAQITGELERLLLAATDEPFDLAAGPVFRVALFKLREQEHVLLFVSHHIVADGWSNGLLLDELSTLYHDFVHQRPPSLPELPLQYADYAVWQRSSFDGPELEEHLVYWKQYLEGAPAAIALPSDSPRPQKLSYRGVRRPMTLPRDLSDQLIKLSRQQGASLFMVMLTALQILLFRWTGQDDLVIGTVSANRTRKEIEHLIGCFLNFLPLRGKVSANNTAAELVEQTKKSVLGSFVHQECPFEKIIEATQPERLEAVNPIYNVAFLMQNFPELAFSTDSVEARFLQLNRQISLLDLRLVAEETTEGINLHCEYSADLFEADTIEHFLHSYRSVLEQLVSDPKLELASFTLSQALTDKADAARRRSKKQKIAISASFTAEPLKASIAFWMEQLGIPSDITFAPFNQVFQQLLDPSSLLARNTEGINIVLLRVQDCAKVDAGDGFDGAQIEVAIHELLTTLQNATQHSETQYILCVCPPSRAISANAASANLCRQMEDFLEAESSETPGINVITSQELFELYPVSNYEDEYAEKVGRIPYTQELFTALGTIIARRIQSIRSTPYEVIVLGCDETLWNGKCSRDGALGVNVDAAQKALQEFMVAQQRSGMLLCLCSNSTANDVHEVFEKNPGMVLSEDQITASQINERPTSQKLQILAQELGLDLDRFIFINHEPSECAEVQVSHSEVLTLELPDHPAQISNFLRHVWPFDQSIHGLEPAIRPLRSDLVVRIASELNDVETIGRAVESQHVIRGHSQSGFVKPSTPTEEILSGIWTRLLHIAQVGVHEDFFILGGHSLLATQVVARIRQMIHVELPLRAVFEAPTIAKLAQRIDSFRRESRGLEVPPLVKKIRDKNLPLSFAQQRLWFLDQLEPGTSLYNVPQMLRMRGDLNVQALHKSINEVVRRHEALRTSFVTVDNEPLQVISSETKLPLPITDLSGLNVSNRETEAQRLAKQEAELPFDLSKGPLLRTTLLKLGDDEYILLLTMHHVVSDRWSVGVLAEEVAALYAAFAKDKVSPLPELAIQYADYAAWQRQWLKGEHLEKQLTFWKEHLAGAPALLELPTDRPRPAVQTYRGSTQTVSFPKELLEKLTSLSRSHGVTLFMTLLAALQTLFYRYSGQDDIVVGSPIANRNYAETESLIGFFVNTLPLRGDLSGNPAFRELLDRVKERALEAYAHQDIPFEKLVEEVHPERSLSHNPIFQVLFALQNAPMKALELPGLRIEREPIYNGSSIFDMSWFAVEVPSGLLLRVEYNTDLFDAPTITGALGHFRTLLEGIAAHPEQHLSELPLLNNDERNTVLLDFNATGANHRKDVCLHYFFENQARCSPSAMALIVGEQRITYSELNSRANQLAHFLRRRGVGPEVLVGVCLRRTDDLIVAVMGILKSGGAYVPIDPAYPKERVKHILDDANTPILLTEQTLAAGLPATQAKTIYLDVDWPSIALEPTENPELITKPDNVAYVLFTSGSTGRPKGVALEHHSAATFVQWAQTVFTSEELSGVLFSTSICFDLSVFEIFVPLSTGGTIILAPDALHLPALPEKNQVKLINTVPSAIAELIRINGIPPSVKTVNLAGEPLTDALVEQIYASSTVEKVYNLYGPTEDTTYSTYTLVSRGNTVTIGRPLDNTQAYVLDSYLNPVPIGVSGELYLAGEGLARGYLGLPALTAERFVTNPFDSKAGSRMYRTGDLCRWRRDGTLQYQGRTDNQVKLRGFRIELGEIEAILAKHPAVRQCAVVAREDEPGLKRLVAYVEAVPDATPEVGGLREHIRQSLPEFMVPSAFVVMNALPLSPNGKVNRRALPVPNYVRDDQAQYIAPRTEVEKTLAAIWSEVLHVPQIGVHDNFFSIGGHSLLATQVISRLRQAFNTDLPLRSMFEAPTVAELALRLKGQNILASQEVPSIPRVPRDRPLPLSFAQQRLWFLNELEPNNPLYNIPLAIRMTGVLRHKELTEALNEIVRRHEVLRTTFAVVNQQPVQIIAPKLEIEISIADLSKLRNSEQEAAVQQQAMEEAQRVFNLKTGPLLRAKLLLLGTENHVLLLNTHHIATDGWSIWRFIDELAALYAAYLEGRPSPVPELSIQYADFAVWQRNWMQSDLFEKQLGYWKKQLDGAPDALELPIDRLRPAVQSYRGATATVVFPKDLADKLTTLSRDEGATLFMTLFAAYQTLLFRYTGQEDVVVGTPIANRVRAEVEQLIGIFVNTLVMRSDLTGNPTFRELLRRVRAVALGAYAHQDIPFEKLVEALRPERDLGRTPLFQAWFTLHNSPRSAFKLPGLELESMNIHNGTSKFDLGISMFERPDGLSCTAEYSTDLFDADTIQALLAHFRMLLEGITANPDQQIATLPLLTKAEHHKLVVEWNDTKKEFPRNRSLHEFIEQQVYRTPDATAVVFESQRLSYREVNARANQLAHRLRQLGVGPEVLVGVCLERSVEMVVGLLAIMKAGGAYVPIDPDLPRERLTMMLEDARPPVLLTQERLLDTLPTQNLHTICLDRDWPTLNESVTNPEVLTGGRNLAYAIYTSGSTGKPKGVLNVHQGIVNRLLWMQDAYRLDGLDFVLQKTPYTFDVSVWEFFWPLMTGACLVIARPSGHKDPSYLVNLIVEQGITTMHFVPSMLSIFLETPGVERCTSLRQVFCSGEALPFELQERFFQRLGSKLHNLYGPTEASVDVTYFPCLPNSGRSAVPIGKPIWNTQIYILDRYLQPVPIGVAGELHIGGTGLALGYLNRPELTQQKFIPDPFSEEPNARLYKSGDLAKFEADGNVAYLGRTDDQVKIRGFRIELGEIQTTLESHPDIRESVVVAREDKPGDRRLVAYLVANRKKATSEQPEIQSFAETLIPEVRRWLAGKLPQYMIPSFFVLMDSLPLSANGKVNRKALPIPEQARPRCDSLTPTEEIVAAIWADVLGIEGVGPQDNFFELGGHSLTATQAISRVREAFHVELALRTIFEAPTVAAQAEIIERAQLTKDDTVVPLIVSVSKNQPLPLSFAQQRLWFLDQLEPNNPLYNVPWAIRMHGSLNLPVLESALDSLIERHEILRTTYQIVNDHPVQVVTPKLDFRLAVVDLGTFSAATRENEARRIAEAEATRPFDLSRDPMLRCTLLVLDKDEYVLLLNSHHIATDGWSTGILLNDLAALYGSVQEGASISLSPLSVQYADYAVWQRGWLQGEILERQLSYWRKKLAGAPPVLLLPTDRPRRHLQAFRGAEQDVLLPKDLADRIHLLSRHQGVTPFMTMLAAFKVLLFHYVEQPDIVVGTDVANRTNLQTEALIGFFVNLLVLRSDLSGNPSFQEILTRTREVALGAYAHQDLPFDKLVEELEPERSLSHNPLVQVLFVQQNIPSGAASLPGIKLSSFKLEAPSKFDLAVFVGSPREMGVSTNWRYNPDLFDSATILRMAELYRKVLDKVTLAPQITLNGLREFMAELDRQKQVSDQKEFQNASLQKLKQIKRKAMSEL